MSPGRLQPDDWVTESLHPAQDEAIAAAIRESQPGDEIAIHSDACNATCLTGNVYDQSRCSCEPIVIKLGAVA